MNTERISDIVAVWDVRVCGAVGEILPGVLFRFSSERGDDLVLKEVGDIDDGVLNRLAFEYEVILHVHNSGLPVAVPLRDGRGRIAVPWEGHYYQLSPCLPNADGEVTGPGREQLFHNYGKTIAQMHLALAAFPHDKLEGRVERTVLESEVFDVGLPIITAYLSGRQEAGFRAMLADLEQAMRDAFRDLPEQLIHRDCHAENLLSWGSEVTGIVDWDHLMVGPRILDVAYFAVQAAKHDVRDAGKMAQWFRDLPLLVQGYASVSALSAEERAAIPYVMIAVPIFFAHWAISAAMDTDYIQQELDAATCLYDNLDTIQEAVLMYPKGRRTNCADTEVHDRI
jgi:Ser/Thr protein kinase RdoA (MazF antagonist)